MQYSFTCPLEGCGQKMTVEATGRDEAVEKLSQMAKAHLAAVHPDVQKTDEQVHSDIDSMTVEEDDPGENTQAS